MATGVGTAVLGVQVQPSQFLAKTGIDSLRLQVFVALALLAIGYAFSILGRPLVGAHYRR